MYHGAHATPQALARSQAPTTSPSRGLCSAAEMAALGAQEGLADAVAELRNAIVGAATGCDLERFAELPREGLGEFILGGGEMLFFVGPLDEAAEFLSALEDDGVGVLAEAVVLLDFLSALSRTSNRGGSSTTRRWLHCTCGPEPRPTSHSRKCRISSERRSAPCSETLRCRSSPNRTSTSVPASASPRPVTGCSNTSVICDRCDVSGRVGTALVELVDSVGVSSRWVSFPMHGRRRVSHASTICSVSPASALSRKSVNRSVLAVRLLLNMSPTGGCGGQDRRADQAERRAAPLVGWVRASSMEQRLVVRARVVLLAAEGRSNDEIARELGVVRQTAAKWWERFRSEGVAGLGDASRPGRPPRYDHDDRLAIAKTVTEEPPDPESHWTMSKVADALRDDVGISASQVWRILSELDLKPWQSRSWLTSHAPGFWDRAADVCGLYLNPPEGALVLSVDEKTGMQAKSHINPTKPARPGLTERKEFEYRRHGTACLFAALDVHTGEIISKTKGRIRSVEFIDFLEHLDTVTPKHLVLHLVLDNGPSHISKETRKWLGDPTRQVRFVVHHTPTHASWLNQIELFFSILGRRLLRRGEFESVDELVAKVIAFITDYNHRAKPFRWTYEGKPLKAA